MALKSVLVLVLTISTTSCGLLKPPDQLDRDARQLLSYVRSDRIESARAMLQVNAPLDTLDKYLAAGRDFIRLFPPDSLTLVGWNVVQMGGDTTGSLTYEARGAGRTALIAIGVARRGGAPAITAFHWQESAKPLAVANAFTFTGKTPMHYLYLMLAVLAALTCIGGAVFAGVQRLGVAWILISLIGVGSFSIDWTTGATAVNPVSIHLLGAGFVRSGAVAPWILTWSIPLGTILMLIVWRQRKRRGLAARATPAPTSPV